MEDFIKVLISKSFEAIRHVSGGRVESSYCSNSGEFVSDYGLGEGRDGLAFAVDRLDGEVADVEVILYPGDKFEAEFTIRGTVDVIASAIGAWFEEPSAGSARVFDSLKI